MPRERQNSPAPSSPAWQHLYATAEPQAGLFTLTQAEACGYSSQHLQKHLRAGRIHRVQRGIYRLTQFPAGEHEELVALWLWSGRVGVFSHETSLFLHDLSDVLPARVHLTVPTTRRARRMRIPEGLILHHDDLADSARTWVEVVPVTTARQAISECIVAHVSPELIEQAIRQARQRGLISSEDNKSLMSQLRMARSTRS
ncbi:MAG: type IV toxin-antitoxin system AbiEi family antitoxin domain-containing protein [Planctomycetes bacterium]|nr:type IV toxin-antitoxin system AbiEi family antitoxin domain-containing protein [Planctomycetota bacterium]MCC7396453.1 type IV toxin-antitoxin system AbiEi family antitoxin domain-containing protein [Planctomycetota bacterium]